MRIHHQEIILPTRGPSAVVVSSSSTAPKAPPTGHAHGKKRKRATSENSFGGGGDGEGEGEGEREEEEIVNWTEEEEEWYTALKRRAEEQGGEAAWGTGRNFVAYVVEKAKFSYVGKEHEGLCHELEVLGARESELGAECEVLLRRVLRAEMGCVCVFFFFFLFLFLFLVRFVLGF